MADVEIRTLGTETIAIPIVSVTPLLMHRFSEKAKRIMLGRAQGETQPKTPKDPTAEYEAAIYRLKDGRPGFPAIGFKGATVSAARVFGKDVPMTMLRQSLFFHGEPGDDGQQMVPIVGEFEMREDVVRVARGGTDLRYRPMFQEWTATLEVTYLTGMLTRDSVLSIIEAGGLTVGVGDWRPERNGDFGQYRIDTTRDVEVIKAG